MTAWWMQWKLEQGRGREEAIGYRLEQGRGREEAIGYRQMKGWYM